MHQELISPRSRGSSAPASSRPAICAASWTLAVLALVQCGAVLAADGTTTPVKLELRPAPGLLAYTIDTTERQSLEGKSGPAKDHVYACKEVVGELIRPGTGSDLNVTVEVEAKTISVDGIAVPTKIPARSRYAMDRRGQPRSATGTDVAQAFWPLLPSGPVPVGFRWQTEAPPSKDFPFRIQVNHELKRIAMAHGSRCGVIHTSAKTAGTDPATGVKVALLIHGATEIGLDDGILVKAVTEVDVAFEYPRPDAAGQTKIHRITRRTIERIGAGSPSRKGDP